MSDKNLYKASGGAVFIQYGDGLQVYPLGNCVNVDNLPNPGATTTPRFCFNPTTREYEQVAEERTPPGQPAFNVSSFVGPSASYLERVREAGCPFNLYVAMSNCYDVNVFGNGERFYVYRNCRFTDDGIATPVQHEGEPTLVQTWALTGYTGRIDHRPLTASRISTAEVAALNHIAAADARCAGTCGARRGICEAMTASADNIGGAAVPDVLLSINSGATWTSPASGFAATTDVMCGQILQVNNSTERYIYVRNTLAANPLQVEYSDDATVTWTEVDVGATVAEAAVGGGSMYFIPGSIIGYICTDDGRVFKTINGGASWVDQTTALAASGAAALNAIHFADVNVGYAVGAADLIIGTVDGGENWTTETATGSGDGLDTVWVFSQDRLIVGTDSVVSDNPLYMSYDATANWTTIDTGLGALVTDTVPCVVFLADGLTGYLIKNTAAPVGRVFKTINGGQEWFAQEAVTNSGMNWLHICLANQIYGVGEIDGGTSFIFNVSG